MNSLLPALVGAHSSANRQIAIKIAIARTANQPQMTNSIAKKLCYD